MRFYRIFKERGVMFPCGIVKKEDEWCIWRLWSVEGNDGITYKKIPHSLQCIFKVDDCGYQWIKFELEEYDKDDWGHFGLDELEHHYDDISSDNDSEDSEENSE